MLALEATSKVEEHPLRSLGISAAVRLGDRSADVARSRSGSA